MARIKTSHLGQRIVSALALGPVPIAAIWFGAPWLPLVTAGAAAVMAWEWGRLLDRGRGQKSSFRGPREAEQPGTHEHRPLENGFNALRPSTRPPRGRLRMGSFINPVIDLPHGEGVPAAPGRVSNHAPERMQQVAGSVRVGAGLVVAVVAAVAAAALAPTPLAIGVALLGAAVASWLAPRADAAKPGWAALGALWVALPCIAFLWLAGAATGGRATLLWVLAVVWATDIGAYAFGSTLGGPRLAPQWSPKKTWAGLLGGVMCAALVGAVTAHILGSASLWLLSLLSGGLAVVGQLGDLAESLAKRRFGVKDSSGLIPGHGGLLDRLDGLLAVLPTVALLTWVGGRNVLTWR